MILSIFLLGFLFMLFNELEDECIVGNWSGKLTNWNSRESWRNKWAIGSNNNPLPYEPKWYHFGISLPHAERFPYSSTFLVFLTDAEHCFQMGKILAICWGFGLIDPILGFAFFFGHLWMGVAKETILKRFIKG